MAFKAIASSILLLRISILLALVACVVLFIINTITVTINLNRISFDIVGTTRVTFKDFIAYSYVLSVAVVGAGYTLIQIPFAMYLASTGKRMISNGCLPAFDFYGDKVIRYLLATGIGAGLAYSCEIKLTFLDSIFAGLAAGNLPGVEESKDGYERFINKGIIATSLLGLGLILMVILLALPSINERSKRKGFFG
ncbi:hypothetical protein Tsubulata_039488 [Turnera subulata]|uniref:CASP-like protein n=1 Tax=Turnera subulata TaxID=218843 RepID=A0A9Q0J1E5_9ROSI|nr:hypothetical protein Tsubulata_039488 [Turnera subulata]